MRTPASLTWSLSFTTNTITTAAIITTTNNTNYIHHHHNHGHHRHHHFFPFPPRIPPHPLPNSLLSDYLVVWLSGRLAAWLFGRLAVWLSWRMSVKLSGRLDVLAAWMYKFMDNLYNDQWFTCTYLDNLLVAFQPQQ